MDELSARQALARLIADRRERYEALSKMLGRNPAYIQQYIKRGTPRKLDEADRRALARYFGVDERLLGGPQDAPLHGAPSRRRAAPPVVIVPRLALGASAGAGSLDDDEQASGAFAFDPVWLRGLGVKADGLSIIRVDGESMAPTLSDGDDIMVDRADGAERLRDGIYVLRLDDVLMVKRVALGPQRGRFSVLSDNRHYPDWTDIDPALVDIVGRVIWTGRRVG
ncbi:S24 family peptidase [Sphingobium algorifonticola]|uniref:S24 family peptidase n=1 Tax=Sphingobium algorifonticola TaxID=2008318 RepID=A0A437J5L2_9SPHN|nr:S24 family peptidase [Sphingobium algorifonticola]RVT40131.1 S24 family peptidase [Sphingobium algorifonticola]